ncbi:MAG: putative Zn-dependent hydrolases of the beta-lactamase fold protein [Candidatus Woesebacteria bacterium GW2011_GWA1_33_30]|uniref:Putative Zn-dependent hydrolases of the beta-lactamase fold protein n=1 Tax=Candidatus Woesebacteria bacterium GW2011_GWA2_33_28 TaxID=1618561 RepID=A0A0G0C9Z9_9BACT|nr:MAG: putative Zn-dependent hydrolases of the beta-lactamase fold protein [Candidatus Woesebacteria bacterium GW2011_GWA2_33_28]KKP48823.1 MAG: putative Zn-dependent hydrolases of the beta-lactamase fold protein [Candidatus Woesebacteria bacterium GW2011_GWA1_33_30]KKP50096.1 MAG: putative Zn-dependent hydrolases of the beta-lactamase fold protein [Microgenomates group bacterium GW2011_GWC1_33_32]KKP51867.1 MAG: putative Zn-dependent hydrolases of the beta-lactamase fold protein [Candidatus Wo
MEITIKNNEFRVKGKTGVLYSKPNGVLIETPDGIASKELLGAGEYEVSGISVIGIQAEEKEIIFVYEVDGLRICNLNNLTKKLTDSKVSAVGDVDILLLPVGASSIEMMQQLESYYVIPFGQKSEEELEKFLKESGLVTQRISKFVLKKEEIIEDQTTEIIVI